jgi:hypothetical protein
VTIEGAREMPRQSGRPKARRLIVLGLVLLIVPSADKNHDRSSCETKETVLGALVCTPIDLVRILAPLARFLLADIRPVR